MKGRIIVRVSVPGSARTLQLWPALLCTGNIRRKTRDASEDEEEDARTYGAALTIYVHSTTHGPPLVCCVGQPAVGAAIGARPRELLTLTTTDSNNVDRYVEE